MSGKRVVAVSAIGNPASFEQTISGVGAEIIESVRFPDHHDYTEDEILDVMVRAADKGAEAIFITEKDAVKIPVSLLASENSAAGLPIYVLTIAVKIIKGENEFNRLLKSKINDKLKKLTEKEID